ncbi:MAG: HDOD domain-containing protein, partial [Planctomycetes bacterium]|nr:HDOD domain-containing protein [Planctomycetota bacterium]
MITTIQVSEIDGLAPMPASVSRLTDLLTDESVNLTEIANVIKWDEALTANVLKKVNSVTSGVRIEIKSIQDAVVR